MCFGLPALLVVLLVALGFWLGMVWELKFKGTFVPGHDELLWAVNRMTVGYSVGVW